jgi:catechol 2,3-dioxygenase-like lactoylglutathione lyase family enzyme
MSLRVASIALLVADYDEALAWFTTKLGFILVEDTPLGPDKRWLLIAAPADKGPGEGNPGCHLLLARAADAEQKAQIGRAAGGRVAFFLQTDDFARDHAAFLARGVKFLEAPRQETYGRVAVFADLYGNRWDLIQPSPLLSAGRTI